MGSQRVGHDWATELNWTESIYKNLRRIYPARVWPRAGGYVSTEQTTGRHSFESPKEKYKKSSTKFSIILENEGQKMPGLENQNKWPMAWQG